MDIKHRKSRKKSKILRKPERNTEPGGENGHKAQKKRKKVQNYPEAKEKYGAEQEKMDIKHRKSRKKSKIIQKPKGNTELSRRKWT